MFSKKQKFATKISNPRGTEFPNLRLWVFLKAGKYKNRGLFMRKSGVSIASEEDKSEIAVGETLFLLLYAKQSNTYHA